MTRVMHRKSTGDRDSAAQKRPPASDALKKKTMDNTLESTLKESINTMLPTCDDKGAFTDDDDTYRKHK